MHDPILKEELTGHTKLDSECLQKAAEDEPIFVLRGQDITAPGAIMQWINENFETAPEQKLIDAFSKALLMRRYPKRKTAD